MKKSILILGILLPLFSLSQSINKVITKENKIYIGDIYKSYGNNITWVSISCHQRIFSYLYDFH